MPTRVIRDGILTSETIASLSLGAQLLYHCLLLVVDDHGLYEASPRILRSKCFPLRDDGSPHPVTTEMVAGWLDECMAASDISRCNASNSNGRRARRSFRCRQPPLSMRCQRGPHQ